MRNVEDELYTEMREKILERRSELSRQLIANGKMLEQLNLNYGLPIDHGMGQFDVTSSVEVPQSGVEVGKGRFGGMARPAAVFSLLEYNGSKMVAREILKVLDTDNVAPTGRDKLHKVQVALNRRAASEGDIIHVGDGYWALVKWYSESEIAKFVEARNPVGARDKAEHARRMSIGIKKLKANGAHYGAAPKITPAMWDMAKKLLQEGNLPLTKIHKEIIKLTPKGEKPIVYNALRNYHEKLRANEPYPASWQAYFDAQKSKIEEEEQPDLRLIK